MNLPVSDVFLAALEIVSEGRRKLVKDVEFRRKLVKDVELRRLNSNLKV